MTTRPDGRPPATFGRFEASRPNELWPGDALHGPHIAGRKAYLFAFLDDHSRAVMAARWGFVPCRPGGPALLPLSWLWAGRTSLRVRPARPRAAPIAWHRG